MNIETTAVNITCPHCGKDSYQRIVAEGKGLTLTNVRETGERKCGNCSMQFKVIIDTSIKTEKL